MKEKIAIVLGRGVEGCGVSMSAVQFNKAVGSDTFATMDKKWPRGKGLDLQYTGWYAGKENENQKMIETLNGYDLVIFYSVPSKKHPEACQKGFLELVQKIKPRKALINVDHKIQSITRNAFLAETCEAMDIIMTHSLTNPFSKWVKEHKVTTPLVKMGVGFDYDDIREKYWKPIEEQVPNVIRWIGRNTGWKGPHLMIDFHQQQLMDAGFITILEGLEASISYKDILYTDKEYKVRKAVNNFFRPEKEYGDVPFNPEFHGKEVVNSGAYLYPPYINREALERLSISAFGSDLYHLDSSMYGNNIENCHAECIATGTVPLFHKHFGENVIHKVQGKPVSECKDTGTLLLDYTNFVEVRDLMIKLKNDNVMRDEWRNMAFEFWKQHSDGKDEVLNIIKLAKTEVEPVVYESPSSLLDFLQ